MASYQTFTSLAIVASQYLLPAYTHVTLLSCCYRLADMQLCGMHSLTEAGRQLCHPMAADQRFKQMSNFAGAGGQSHGISRAACTS